MKQRSKYRCECCDADIKTGAVVCRACIADFYWLQSLWMLGLNQNEAPKAQEVEK